MTLISVFAPADATKLAFWTDVSSGVGQQRIDRNQGRAFFGNAALMPGTRSNTNDTWLSSSAVGANWAPRDSTVAVMQDWGGMALTGASRASDGDAISSPPATIGVSGFTINDTTVVGRNAWSLYSDVQHQPNASISNQAQSFGLEMALKNKASDIAGRPYGLGYGVHGLWIQCGGDASYGGASTNPINSGITFKKGGNTTNVGILFDATAIAGTDGVTGTGVAMALARGHRLNWYYAGDNLGASIYSTVDAANSNVTMVFDDNTIQLFGTTSNRMFSCVQTANGINGVQVRNAASGSPARIIVTSTDANAGLNIGALGTGVVTMEAQLVPAASTTARSSINLPTGAAPTSPVDGDIWREDNTDTGLKIRVNGATKTVTLA